MSSTETYAPTPEQSRIKERLLAKSQYIQGPLTAPCLIWGGCCDKHGYGVTKFEGKTILIHRLAVFINTGEMPIKHVLHKCDNPACWEFNHLFQGSQADNMADMWHKKRGKPGITKGPQLLSIENIYQLKKLSNEGWSQRKLARKFLVSQATVGNYLRSNHG